jgi:hypothetical protein
MDAAMISMPRGLPRNKKIMNALRQAERIRPALVLVRGSLIARSLKVSNSYARDIRKGRVVPHPHQWGVLADLTGHQPRMPCR